MSAPGQTSPRRPGNRRRPAILLAIAMVAPVALILGTLAAVPFLARRSQPDPSIEYAMGDLRVRADLAIDPSGDFKLTLRFRDPQAAPARPVALEVVASMEMGAMAPVMPMVTEISLGNYEATGRLPMQGRWRFLTSTDQGAFEITGYAGASF
jgi:hypothetical protein